jgi:hypothetical protein
MWVNFEVLPVTFGGKIANHGNLTEVTVTAFTKLGNKLIPKGGIML